MACVHGGVTTGEESRRSVAGKCIHEVRWICCIAGYGLLGLLGEFRSMVLEKNGGVNGSAIRALHVAVGCDLKRRGDSATLHRQSSSSPRGKARCFAP